MERLSMNGEPFSAVAEKVREALAGAGGVQVLADNRIAVQNLEKLAGELGFDAAYRPFGEGTYLVTIEKKSAAPAPTGGSPAGRPEEAAPAPPPAAPPANEGMTVLVTKNGFGAGSKDLAQELMAEFIASLAKLAPAPKAVIFTNGGALLTCEGSAVLPDLKALAGKGCDIITSASCIRFFKLEGKLAVGAAAAMDDISARLAAAGKTVTI